MTPSDEEPCLQHAIYKASFLMAMGIVLREATFSFVLLNLRWN